MSAVHRARANSDATSNPVRGRQFPDTRAAHGCRAESEAGFGAPVRWAPHCTLRNRFQALVARHLHLPPPPRGLSMTFGGQHGHHRRALQELGRCRIFPGRTQLARMPPRCRPDSRLHPQLKSTIESRWSLRPVCGLGPLPTNGLERRLRRATARHPRNARTLRHHCYKPRTRIEEDKSSAWKRTRSPSRIRPPAQGFHACGTPPVRDCDRARLARTACARGP
jgi:hypothetical protein